MVLVLRVYRSDGRGGHGALELLAAGIALGRGRFGRGRLGLGANKLRVAILACIDAVGTHLAQGRGDVLLVRILDGEGLA